MVLKRSWETYPLSYRAREARIIAGWVQAGESGSVIGLAGTGKSNFFGFLSHQPQAIASVVKHSPLKLALVLVDLNSLPAHDLATFYRLVLRSLFEARSSLAVTDENLPNVIEASYRKVEEKTDPFLLQSTLREALYLFRDTETRLALMLDSFDRFCQATTTQVLDNLRGLRDSFKTTLSYVVGLRHRLIYTCDPVDLGELYEILDTHVCWMWPMEQDDARWVIDQVEEGIGISFRSDQVEQLIHLTGGHPALLKAATFWLAKTTPSPETQAWATPLLAEPSIQSRLQELWQGLTGEEQLALSDLQALRGKGPTGASQEGGQATHQEPNQILAHLQEKGLCRLDTDDRYRVFAPLFAAYIDRQAGSGKIWQRETDDAILRGNTCLDDALTAQDRTLLTFFLEHPRKILSKDRLASALWPDEEILGRGVEDVRLQQAVRHLRSVIEAEANTPRYIQTARGIGYRFFPEGVPRG